MPVKPVARQTEHWHTYPSIYTLILTSPKYDRTYVAYQTNWNLGLDVVLFKGFKPPQQQFANFYSNVVACGDIKINVIA